MTWITRSIWVAALTALFTLLLLLPALTSGITVPLSTLLLLLVASLLLASFSVGLSYTYGILAPRLGRKTAAVALIAGMAVFGMGLSAAAGCPGSATPGQCTVNDSATWGVTLALLMALVAGVVLASNGIKNMVRRIVQAVRRRKAARAEKAERDLVAAGRAARPATRSINPQAPKGYPTPRRSKSSSKRRNIEG